jgi:hypothetical protein
MSQETREASAEEERLEARLSELLGLMRDDYLAAQGADSSSAAM